MSRVAFLGLGAMGSRMAVRLMEAGHDLTVWNRSPERAAPLEEKGAKAAATPREAAGGAEFVIAMVRDDDASREVWEGADGALGSMGEGAIALEMSTVTAGRARAFASAAKAAGAVPIDAPVSGSRPQAEAGELVILAGGRQADVERAKPLLLAMGKSVEHAGPIGAGATAKLLVNAALGTQVAMMAELLSLGAKLGLEPEKTLDLLSATPWASPAAKTAGGLMVKRSFDPLFPVELVAKDLGYAAGASEEAKTPIIDAARALFEDAEANGLAAENMSAVVKRYEAG